MSLDKTSAKMIDKSGATRVTPRSGANVSKVATTNLGLDVSTKVKESPSPMFTGREAAPRNDVS